MAILCELDEGAFDEWVATRPEKIRALIKKYPPNRLYRLKTSNHRVTIAAYEEREDGRVGFRVDVTGEYNLVAMERSVFGIDPEDLEECDLPGPGEDLGNAGLSPEAFVDAAVAAGLDVPEKIRKRRREGKLR